MCKEYNGWTNYETWNVSLWMNNDGYAYWEEESQECYNNAEGDDCFTRDERATLDLADRIKEYHDEQMAEITGVTGVFTDLLNAALSSVNWYEIARHFIDDVEKEEETESA